MKMDEVTGLKLADAINADFGPPFLEAGHVHAIYRGNGVLQLRIGRRDADLNLITGEIDSAGTSVG